MCIGDHITTPYTPYTTTLTLHYYAPYTTTTLYTTTHPTTHYRSGLVRSGHLTLPLKHSL